MTGKPIPPTTGPAYEFAEYDETGAVIDGTEVVIQAPGWTDKRSLEQVIADDANSPWKKKWNPEDSRQGKYNPPKKD